MALAGAGERACAAQDVDPAAHREAEIVVQEMPRGAPGAPDLVAGSDSGSSNTDDITNDNTPDFTGTAENGATVKVFAGATQIANFETRIPSVLAIIALIWIIPIGLCCKPF